MIEVNGKVTGGKELARAFRELGAAPQKRVLLSSARATGRVVAKDFRDATPRGPRGSERSPASEKYGAAVENVKVRKLRGPALGVRVNWGPAFWMRLRERGTAHQPPRPLMRPLWDSRVKNYLDHLIGGLARGLQREAKKIAGSYAKAKKSLGVKG
jgi:hypothetical protein